MSETREKTTVAEFVRSDAGYGLVQPVILFTLGGLAVFGLPGLLHWTASTSSLVPDSVVQGLTGASIVVGLIMIVIAMVLLAMSVTSGEIGGGKEIEYRAQPDVHTLHIDPEPVEQPTPLGAELVARHDAVLDAVLEYTDPHLGDIDKLLRFPLLSDPAEPVVENLVTAQERARDLRMDKEELESMSRAKIVGTTYYQAVGDLERAWEKARTEAERVAASRMGDTERKLLDQAQAVWSVTLDEQGTTPQERLNAYEQLEKLMRRLGLISQSRTPKLLREIETAKTQTRMLTGVRDGSE